MNNKIIGVISASSYSVKGYIESMHIRMEITEEERTSYGKMDREEQIDFIKRNGDIIIDEFVIEDCGTLTNLEINNIN